MRWEDERYVRLYTRDTLSWLGFGWEGQAVVALLFRKVDRAGVLEIGELTPEEALSAATGVPLEVCKIAWPRISAGKNPTVTLRDETSRALIIPQFIEAQEARQSDAARARKSREMARALRSVTGCDGESQIVTKRHTRSHAVTPSRAVPSRTEEGSKSLVEQGSTAGPAEQVFQEWQRVHNKPKAQFSPERRRKVEARLKDYPIEMLIAAVRGCKKSPHHQGQNDTGTKYDDLELICRDGKHVETFAAMETSPPEQAMGGVKNGEVFTEALAILGGRR